MQQDTYYNGDGNKIQAWFSKHQTVIQVTVLSIALIILLIFAIAQSGDGANRIKKELEKAGYDVSGIDFVLVDKGSVWSDRGRIYQSSKAIEVSDEVFVDQWELKSYHYGTSALVSYWVVKPHPEVPSLIPVNIQLTITQKDYDLLKEQAGEQKVEEYIKQLIRNSTKEAGEDGKE